MGKHNWKRTAFYIRRGLLRWAVMVCGTLASISLAVYLLENPNSRLMFYIVVGAAAALCIGNLFYGREDGHGKSR